MLPLTLMIILSVGIAAGLLSLTRVTIPAVGLGTRLGRGESLTIHLRGRARGWGGVKA